jgi:hypothetical protein
MERHLAKLYVEWRGTDRVVSRLRHASKGRHLWWMKTPCERSPRLGYVEIVCMEVGDTVCWGDLAGDVDGMMTTESMEGPVVVREIAVLS